MLKLKSKGWCVCYLAKTVRQQPTPDDIILQLPENDWESIEKSQESSVRNPRLADTKVTQPLMDGALIFPILVIIISPLLFFIFIAVYISLWPFLLYLHKRYSGHTRDFKVSNFIFSWLIAFELFCSSNKYSFIINVS